VKSRRNDIASIIREQLARAASAGSLREGDRLPSTRHLSTQLNADPRVIAAAYRFLEKEGLVQLRARSGIFYSGKSRAPATPTPEWLVSMLAGGVDQGIPLPGVAEWITRATTRRRIRAVVIATTLDQSRGVCRELRDIYGIAGQSLAPSELPPLNVGRSSLPRVLRQADVLISTAAEARKVLRLAERHGKRYIRISIRSDFLGFEWRQLLLKPALLVAADRRFLAMVRDTIKGVPGAGRVRYLIAGEDDLSRIRDDEPTYVTQAAREILKTRRLPGFVLPPARLLAPDCSLELIRLIVELNREAGASG
jgi:DNA-binding transcriptional regulator YhcF (GntR family)